MFERTVRRRLIVVVALFASLGLVLTSCSSDSDDTAGTSQSVPASSIPGLPITTGDLPTVDAPANSKSMTCREYRSLDEATRVAVVKELGVKQNQRLVAGVVATMCLNLPDDTVAGIIERLPEVAR